MPKKLVFVRAVVEALTNHLRDTVPEFYWAQERGRVWPYAPSARWPDQPSLDFHLRHTGGEGVVIRVYQNTLVDPLVGELLFAVKFTTGIDGVGRCLDAMTKFLKTLDVSTL